MQIVVAAVPGQEAITRDNVTLRVDAVVYFRVIDPLKAIINVQNYQFAVAQVAQTSLRSVIGQSDMDQLLSEREKVNAHLKDVIDVPTEQPWGIRVERMAPATCHNGCQAVRHRRFTGQHVEAGP
jgi:regulator of protease activity HflC (stomatin/prohibitin superfamily)